MSEDVKDSPTTPTDAKPPGFLIPSPVVTRRMRTISQSQKAEEGPSYKGTIKEFCREKGHGFVEPEDGSPTLFVHISDVEGEFVPQVGDEVTYKMLLIPPRNEKYQAVNVIITHLTPGVSHMRWNAPLSPVGTPH